MVYFMNFFISQFDWCDINFSNTHDSVHQLILMSSPKSITVKKLIVKV